MSTSSQPLIFFGSDQYSAIVLSHLIDSGYTPYLVTDHPNSMGPTQAELLATAHNLPLSYYPTLPDNISPDTIGFTASFDHLLTEEMINSIPRGIYNLHPSLLPQYRNVSPVQYALALGDQETGITMFKLSSGIDNGEIVAQVQEKIMPNDTLEPLTSRLFHLGAQLILDYLTNPARTVLAGIKPARPLVFTKRLTRQSGFIEWSTVQKLVTNQQIKISDTHNHLLQLRLKHDQQLAISCKPSAILHDLSRALHPWPTLWTLAQANKGELRLSFPPRHDSSDPLLVHLSGKPNPISWDDFKQYYL